LVSAVLAVALIGAGLFIGASWARGRSAGFGHAGCGTAESSWGGMRWGTPGAWGRGAQGALCTRGGYVTSGADEITTLEDAKGAVETYLQDLGYTGLEVEEVMEFERNYYAIAVEEDTRTGAMELLVDMSTGAVGPEPGPNMMWNAKYGMMAGRGFSWGGMMGGGMMGRGRVWSGSGEMTLTAAEAEDAAQRWLDANLPGRTAGEADPFYGYYTLHFLRDGEVDGMLSVHGSTGDVWYHSWHGGFVGMMEETG
jgi:hypothetical protein